MTITLITPKDHAWLLSIQKDYTKLTFQNNGYQYIKKDTLNKPELERIKELESFLKKHIVGFREFNNFKVRESGEIVIRFQYSWTADEESPRTSFTGVGYLGVDELLNGFKKKETN
jgi:hypothetical protein